MRTIQLRRRTAIVTREWTSRATRRLAQVRRVEWMGTTGTPASLNVSAVVDDPLRARMHKPYRASAPCPTSSELRSE